MGRERGQFTAERLEGKALLTVLASSLRVDRESAIIFEDERPSPPHNISTNQAVLDFSNRDEK